jgi:acyl-CoA reductase-like NAD-dependent aldehyde dehydrogenase
MIGPVGPPASAAAQAQPFWAELPLADRGRYLRRAAQVMLDVSAELAGLLEHDYRRTRAEAWALELLPGVDALHWAAAAGEAALRTRRIGPATPLGRGRRAVVVRGPLGVVAVRGSDRAPWAWPLERVGVALMAGNGVLLPRSTAAVAMSRLFERAGLPEGIVSLAGPDELSEAARTFDDAAAGLETKGPMLVRADADVERAAAAAVWGAFAAGGRLAAGVARVLASRDVADRLAARAAELAPDPAAVRSNLAADDPAVRDPDPGAVLAVVAVADDEEALALAAAGPAGGAASVWSADRDRAGRMARALAFPVVWIDDHASAARPRSPERFDEATRGALHATGRLRGTAPWWPPQDPGLPRALESIALLLYGREADRARALREGARPLLRLAARVTGR